MEKIIFWNVDTQYDFMRPDGALYVSGAEKIEHNLEKLTQYAHNNNILIVNTGDWHTPDSKEFSATPDYKKTFPPHCLAGSGGAEFVPATKPMDAVRIDWRDSLCEETIRPVAECNELVLYKDDFDIFKGNSHTAKVLDILKPNKVVVYGVATNVCVHYAVMGLLQKGIEVIVVEDAIKELPGLPLEETLAEWKQHGAKMSKVEEIAR